MQIQEYFEALFNDTDLEKGYIELRAIYPDTKLERFFTQDIHDAVTWVNLHRASKHIYTGINPRNNNITGKAEDVDFSRWIWLDVDGYKLKPDWPIEKTLRYITSKFVLPPHIIVYSGNQGVHLYWKITKLTDAIFHKEIGTRFSTFFKCDNLGNIDRIFRVPDTYNHKTDPPIHVELVHCNPDYEYAPNEIIAALKVSQKIAKKVFTGDKRGYASRSERDWAVVCELIRCGLSDETITYIFNTRVIGDKAREEPAHYLEQTLKQAREETRTPLTDLNEDEQKIATKWQMVNLQDGMYAVTKDNNLRQLSTFNMIPKVLLQGAVSEGEQDTLIVDIHASDFTWEDIAFTRRAFNRSDTLIKELPAMAWQWLGSDKDVRRLLPWLMDSLRAEGLPRRTATPILGLHGNEFIAPTQTLTIEGIAEPDGAKKVWLPTKRVHPKIEFIWIEDEELIEAMDEFFTYFFDLNEPYVMLNVLGWYVSALIKPKLLTKKFRFPMLNIFGTRGAGKTSLIRLMQRLCTYINPSSWDYQSTNFVLLSLLGSTNAVPISFGEYRASTGRHDHIERYIRLSYDTGEDSRGRPDQSTVSYQLLAPFSIDGEDAIGDAACLERLIVINLKPETILEGTDAYDAFEELLEVNLEGIGTRLISWLIDYEPRPLEAIQRLKLLFPFQLPDRVRRNLAVVLSGLYAFNDFCTAYQLEIIDLSDEYLIEIFTPVLNNVVNITTGRTNLIVDEFISDIVIAVEIYKDAHIPPFIYRYSKKTNTLNFNLTSAIGWWTKKRKSEGLPTLALKAVKHQLKERTLLEDAENNLGKYMLQSRTMTVKGISKHLHAVNLTAAIEAGLEIPSKLSAPFSIKIEDA